MDWSIIVLVVFTIVFGVIFERNNRKKENIVLHIIKTPKTYFYVGIYDIVVFLFFVLMALEDHEPIYASMLVVFVLGGVWLTLFAKNWRVELHDDRFFVYNMFNRKKEYKFKEVKLVNTGIALKAYNEKGKRVVGVSFSYPNAEQLEIRYNEYMHKLNLENKKTKEKNPSVNE